MIKPGSNEPNVPMDQVRDKLQTLADQGKVELVKEDEPDKKEDEKPEGAADESAEPKEEAKEEEK